jgi:hypothetical protein
MKARQQAAQYQASRERKDSNEGVESAAQPGGHLALHAEHARVLPYTVLIVM